MDYNIKDAFLKLNKKFILLVTHTSGIKIESIVNLLSNDLTLKTIISYDTDFSIINNKINTILEDDKNKMKLSPVYLGSSIAIIGTSFPTNLIKFNVDLHIHISISKTKYLAIYPEKTKDDYDNLSKLISNDKINKYFNIKDNNITEDNQLDESKLDEVFNYIIDFYEKSVYKTKYEMYATKNIKSLDNLELSDIKDTDSDKLKDSDSDKISNIDININNSDNDSDNENLLESLDSDFSNLDKIEMNKDSIIIPKKLLKKLKKKHKKLSSSELIIPILDRLKKSNKDYNIINTSDNIDINKDIVKISKKSFDKLKKIESQYPFIPNNNIKLSPYKKIFYENHMIRLKGMEIKNHRILGKNIIERTRILNLI